MCVIVNYFIDLQRESIKNFFLDYVCNCQLFHRLTKGKHYKLFSGLCV